MRAIAIRPTFGFRTDQGRQATYTDPISPAFNATSDQPFYGGQIQWTHLFSSNATNQFLFSVNWFSAMFRQNENLANQQLRMASVSSGYLSLRSDAGALSQLERTLPITSSWTISHRSTERTHLSSV